MFRRTLVLAYSLVVAGFVAAPIRAQSAALSAPQEIVLPSALPSGNARNDRLIFTFTPARRAAGETSSVPAVVLLHLLGTRHNRQMREMARYFAARGIASATVTLPYHMERLPRGDFPARHFVGSDAPAVVQAFNQSAADVSSVVTWLQGQNGIDPQKIGVVGVSLGAIVTHLVMGRDARLSGGVTFLGGGDLADIYRTSILGRLAIKPHVAITAADETLLREVDPLTLASQNQPRHVLMIQAARDLVIPPRDSEKLWNALGRPPIRWLDINHFGLDILPRASQRAALAYLQSVWNGAPLSQAPPLKIPSLRAGLISGLDATISPAVTLQLFSIGKRRDHLSLLHGDVGLSGRGPFVGLAATINQFADVGLGRRLGGDRVRPYVSLHLTY